MKNRILFVNPPQNVHNKKSKSMYPSGALVLMATMCQNEGHVVKIFDGAVENEKFEDILIDFNPDYVCITVNTFQTKFANIYLNTVKGFDDSIITVIGGAHPSAIGVDSLRIFPNTDVAVMGEGEFTVLEIVNEVPLEKIRGICYNGTINPPRAYAENLNHVPLPNLDLVDLSKYSGINSGKDRSMFIMASRGCPFQCIYCNKSIFGSTTRFRKPDKIIEEIRWLHETYDINHIYFQDDTFNLKREWIEEILNKIISEGLNVNISYMAPFRANKKLVDEKLLKLMKEANFKTIFYGVESGNQDMLNRMKKGLTLDELRRAFKLTKEADIDIIAAFIIGLPGENHKTVRDTIEFWKELKPTYSGFTMATPFPNTEFEKHVKTFGYLINGNYNEYKCGGSYIRTKELNRTELQFYSNVAIFGQGNEWIYRLPIYWMAKNKIVCNVSVFMMNLYKMYNAWRMGI